MGVPQHIYSHNEEHVAGLQFLAITYIVSINIQVQILCEHKFFIIPV